MVILTGPRQVGKTFLAKQLSKHFSSYQYLNFDNQEDNIVIKKRNWDPNIKLIIFDEIHKMKNWKTFVKGVYDTKPEHQAILITGSARLETFKQMGDSLAGRYFNLRLHPFSVKELERTSSPYDLIEKLNNLGGFPEPFLSNSVDENARWRRQYYTDLIREDIFEYSRIQEINTMKLLFELLRNRVAAPLSYFSLAQDLQVSPNTVKKYIAILASLYIIFLVYPYHKNISRAIQREPKLYFFDTSHIIGNSGVKLENTCAVCLQKYVHYLQDVKGQDIDLCYVRDKEGHEVDFALALNGTLQKLIEIKHSDYKPSKYLNYFAKRIPQIEAIQLVHNLRIEKYHDNLKILNAGKWLSTLPA